MFAYWLAKKEKIRKELGLVERKQDPELEQERYRALYDNTAAEEDEVSFQHGDMILDVQQIDEGWTYGHVERTGQQGIVPGQ
ncbi:LIM and SH3 domain protein 1-like [Brienomyrus brachyistius]|uniref:LIM and SH3 domain protein 1-like n=1 Tax=Brienomyrus brachyistius TaxID=42636 RepID=UPI0020B338C0|nr:LIM and SH3 domain protein 1-like [Brienomyrus brachyistius]